MSRILHTEMLAVGAGPYGLAIAAVARRRGIDCRVVGKPMEFWTSHMPRGMRLRTPCDWEADDSLARFRSTRGAGNGIGDPVSLEFIVDYITTTARELELPIIDDRVERLIHEQGEYKCPLEGGDVVCVKHVVVATGYYDYRFIPAELEAIVPAERMSHTADSARLDRYEGARCLIVGGRQSAFEWAGLLAPFATEVHVVFRHGIPAFRRSDWSWVDPYIEKTRTSPGWYRDLTAEEREAIHSRFWREGRLELEDWLMDGLQTPDVHLHPNARVAECTVNPAGDLTVILDDRSRLGVDRVICATGYQVDIQQVPFLRRGNILGKIGTQGGFPQLDESFQSSLPGLYFTGIHATNDFGPFLFFVAGSFASANVIIDDVSRKVRDERVATS